MAFQKNKPMDRNEAKKSLFKNEVPVGAIIIDHDQNIIAKGHNRVE